VNFSIAVSGKGGTGKTTIASLLIRSSLKAGKVPVLAVDADPNSNLYMSLGLEYDMSIADIREDVDDKDVPAGMTKIQYVALKMEEALVEGTDIDMLVMGRPEGEGCYCAANHLLKEYLSKLSKRYKLIVMDNEAGLEHLSRRTTDDVDVLLIISDPTMVSIRSAVRVRDTARQLDLKIKKTYLVINRVDMNNSEALEKTRAEAVKNKLEILYEIPKDDELIKASEDGRDIFSAADDSPAVKAVAEILRKLTDLAEFHPDSSGWVNA